MNSQVFRKFTTSRRVRVSDSDDQGLIRIDAIARYLQDIGFDDTNDIGVGDGGIWVAKFIEIKLPEKLLMPKRNEIVKLETYCGGYGSAFAQRIVQIKSEQGTIDASTIWVHLDENGKPSKLPNWLGEAYPNAKKIKSPKLDIKKDDEIKSIDVEFVLRKSDLDVNGHMNNAVAFECLLQIASELKIDSCREAQIEYRTSVEKDSDLSLIAQTKQDGFEAWLQTEQNIACAMKWIV